MLLRAASLCRTEKSCISDKTAFLANLQSPHDVLAFMMFPDGCSHKYNIHMLLKPQTT